MTTKPSKSPPYVRQYLEDPNVREWHQTLRLRSEGTADSYLRNIARLWHRLGTSPQDFVQGDQMELDRRCQMALNDLHHHRQDDGRPLSESLLKGYRAAMCSWVEWNGRKVERKLIVGRAPVNPRARTYYIPDKRQLMAVLDAATVRTRASIALIAFAGLRFNVQGNHTGQRGLTLANVHGLARKDGRMAVEALPLRIEVPEELSKNNRAFFTLLGPEGAAYLVAYLNARLDAGEDLGPDSPLLGHEKGANNSRAGPFLITKALTAGIRNAHRRAGLPLPPYIWRSYYGTCLLMAESKGECVRDYRQFWMGHAGDIEATYTVRKTLPPDVLADMEERYMASTRFLETRHDGKADNAAETVMAATFAGLGCTDEEIAALDFDDPDAEAIQALVHDKVAALKATAPTPAASAPVGPSQRLVDVDDVGSWLETGWTWAYNAPVPAGKALVEAPQGFHATWTGEGDASVAA